MKCCICEKQIESFGNNPYPICDYTDYDSRCCDECNMLVINARMLSTKAIASSTSNVHTIKEGNTIVIFWSKNANSPIDFLLNSNKFLAGTIEKVETENGIRMFTGTWGNFAVSEKDSFICIE